MQFRLRLVGLALGVVGATLLSALAPATAAPEQAEVDEVITSLGLATEPADYVLLVDTSGSMARDGRYASMKRQLGRLLAGLDSDDRVSLLTFDSVARLRARAVLGNDPEAILAELPEAATGDHTDIGAGIAAGLAELERPDAHRLAALILLTDGQLDTLPGARYAAVGNGAWKKLKARAGALAKTHQVAGYAVSLQATTDAGLLRKVLPQAEEIGAAAIPARFTKIAGDLLRLRAAEAVKEELKPAIHVAWSGELGGAKPGERVPVELGIASPYPHVPVVVSGLAVKPVAGVEVELAGLPESLSLAPGQRLTVNGYATLSGAVTSETELVLTAQVDSPWQRVLEKDLGVKFAPSIHGAVRVAPAGIEPGGNLLPAVGGATALAALALVVLLLLRTLVGAPMRGLLSFSRDGRGIGDVVLTGRRMQLRQPAGSTELAGLAGSVAGARRKGRGPSAVRLKAEFGGERVNDIVADGGAVDLGAVRVAFISDRSRILEKIGLGPAVE